MSESNDLPLRAENDPKFYGRFRWLGLGALAFMVYCLYDGYVRWPDQMVRGEAFYEVADETLSNEDMAKAAEGGYGKADQYKKLRQLITKDEELAAAWRAKVDENEGWPAAPPAKLRSEGDIVGQYIMAGIALLGAIYFLSTVLRTNGRWIELRRNPDEGAAPQMTSRWGETFTLDQVTAIDKRQWRDKGIAHVRYTGPKGGKRTFVLDNYKYHKKTVAQILYTIEQHAGADKITGGKPEPAPGADLPATPDAAAREATQALEQSS